MPFIRRQRIWWDPVSDASGYVIYASQDSTAFEPGKFQWGATPGIMFKSVHGKTDVVIPDEWPEFPTTEGTYYIGITARDEVGNESDPLLSSGHFKLSAPPAPARGGIEIL
jgi:hypothetical protein